MDFTPKRNLFFASDAPKHTLFFASDAPKRNLFFASECFYASNAAANGMLPNRNSAHREGGGCGGGKKYHHVRYSDFFSLGASILCVPSENNG